jgi:hypothetical protein
MLRALAWTLIGARAAWHHSTDVYGARWEAVWALTCTGLRILRRQL